MSAPETTSKGRPSLLSETAPGAADNSARILASLEGRVAAQGAPGSQRPKKHFVAAALAVVGLGAVGAWQWHSAHETAYPVMAVVGGSIAASAATASAAPLTKQVQQVQQGQQVQQAQAQQAAPPSQAAVIVAGETPASLPSVAGADPLSRALEDGAVPPSGSSAFATGGAAAPGGASASTKATAGKAAGARAEHDSVKRHSAQKHGAARAGKHTKERAKDDSDADLLSALIARTKPYDANAEKKGRSERKGHALSLAERVKACEKSNFFEAQACRWHVCADHWGKDPACPTANATETTR
jgi:hypothetical protein